MREIVNSTYISLDGVIENPQNWPDTGGFTDEGNRIQNELVLGCSAILMGRHTYETIRTLLAAGLLDRLRLWVHPFIIGHGGPGALLYRDLETTKFDLTNTTPLKSGIVVLDYRVRA